MNVEQPYDNDICIVRDFFSTEDLEKINEFILNLSDSDWEGYNDGLSEEEVGNFYSKTTKIIRQNSKEMAILLDKYTDLATRILSEYYSDFYLNRGYYTITRTTDVGMMRHSDDNGSNGVLSGCVFYFNDDYEGGELVYDGLGIDYRPKAGDFVFHPGSDTYEHHVNDVTRGIRLSCSFAAYKNKE